MKQVIMVFTRWFVCLLFFFLFANLAGFVRRMDPKPFHLIGFPFTFAGWGVGMEEFCDLWALTWNGLIALVLSGAVAYVCAASRCQLSRQVPQSNGPEARG